MRICNLEPHLPLTFFNAHLYLFFGFMLIARNRASEDAN